MMNPGNSYQGQKVRVTIVACDPAQRLIHGQFKDGGTTSIAVFEIGSAFRWPKVGEVWTVIKQNNYWILGSRLNNDLYEPFPVTAISGSQMRLDGSTIFDYQGLQVISVATSGIGDGFVPIWDVSAQNWTVGPPNASISITGSGVAGVSQLIPGNNTNILPTTGVGIVSVSVTTPVTLTQPVDSSPVLNLGNQGNAQFGLVFLADGTMQWSDGLNPPDIQYVHSSPSSLALFPINLTNPTAATFSVFGGNLGPDGSLQDPTQNAWQAIMNVAYAGATGYSAGMMGIFDANGISNAKADISLRKINSTQGYSILHLYSDITASYPLSTPTLQVIDGNGATFLIYTDGVWTSASGFGVFGANPVVSQPAAITAPSGGATVDSQARTAINSILALLSRGSGGYGLTA